MYVVQTEAGDNGAEIALDVDVVIVTNDVTALKLPANPQQGKTVRIINAHTFAIPVALSAPPHAIVPGAEFVPPGASAELTFAGAFWWGESAAVAPNVLNGSFLAWGNASLALIAVQNLSPYYSDTVASGFVQHIVSPMTGVIDRMYIRQDAPFGNGNNLVYSLRVNGNPQMLQSIASTATQASNLVDSAAVTQGDLLDMQVSGANNLGGSAPGGVAVTFRFRPTA